MEKTKLTDAEWRERLTPYQYHILREAGTERAFSGEYVNNHEDGIYHCAGCGIELFASDTKFESGSGWPSFYSALAAERITALEDTSHGMRRVEIRCASCDGHLGHVFPDGPQPSGLRYCVNSASLEFEQRTD